jgi:hypothetical protein
MASSRHSERQPILHHSLLPKEERSSPSVKQGSRVVEKKIGFTSGHASLILASQSEASTISAMTTEKKVRSKVDAT